MHGGVRSVRPGSAPGAGTFDCVRLQPGHFEAGMLRGKIDSQVTDSRADIVEQSPRGKEGGIAMIVQPIGLVPGGMVCRCRLPGRVRCLRPVQREPLNRR